MKAAVVPLTGRSWPVEDFDVHRPTGPRTDRDENSAERGAVLHGPRLVVSRREPGSMRVVADLRSRFGPLGPVTLAPLGTGALEDDLSQLRAVAVVLPVDVPADGLLDSLEVAVAVARRAADVLAPAYGNGTEHARLVPERATVVVAGPEGLLRHRRVRRLLTRPGVASLPTDGLARDSEGDPAGPHPVQALADRLVGYGVGDPVTLSTVRAVLDAQRDRWESGDLSDRAVVAEMRATAPGLRHIDDLRAFDLTVRAVHAFACLDGRTEWPRRPGAGGQARSG